jgi:hypothetical protein
MNISLLCKWWWKLEKEEGLWQEIIKYLKHKSIHDVCHKLNDSPMWFDLLKVKVSICKAGVLLFKMVRQLDFGMILGFTRSFIFVWSHFI